MTPTLLKLLLVSTLCLAQDGGTADNIAEFKRFYKAKSSVAEKIEAIHVLGRADDPSAIAALVDCFDDKDPSVRQTAIDVIGGYRNVACAQWLIDNIVANKRLRNNDHKMVATEALGRMGHEIAVLPIVDLLREKDDGLRLACMNALRLLKSPLAVPELLKVLDDAEPALRVGVLDALGAIKDPSANPKVLEALTDSHWQVQSAAVAALAQLRQKESVQPLINLLGSETGRLIDDVQRALLSLTTFDLGTDPTRWQTTWDRVKDNFKIPSEEEIAKAREAFEKAQLRYKPGSDDFAGIPTKSRRQLYVVDISGSMEDPLIDREKFRLEGRTYRSFVKMEVVKAELVRTIENLNDTVFFNVIAFATEVKTWKKQGLVQAHILNRSSAAEWVSRLQPIGGASQNLKRKGGLTSAAGGSLGKTNTYAALMAALDSKSAQAGYDTNMGSPVDTIFFLSDGDPTEGEITETDRILAEVRRVNAVRKITIHTINIGNNERGKNLMAALARENGGTFLDLGQ